MWKNSLEWLMWVLSKIVTLATMPCTGIWVLTCLYHLVSATLHYAIFPDFLIDVLFGAAYVQYLHKRLEQPLLLWGLGCQCLGLLWTFFFDLSIRVQALGSKLWASSPMAKYLWSLCRKMSCVWYVGWNSWKLFKWIVLKHSEVKVGRQLSTQTSQ